MVQKVHAHGTTTTLISATAGSNNTVILTATAASSPTGGGVPTGMVSFWDGLTVLAQMPLNTSGVTSFTLTNFAPGNHALNASYVSDTLFAASTGAVTPTPPQLNGGLVRSNAAFQLTFSNVIGAPFTVLGAADVTLPLSSWGYLGLASEVSPGQYQYSEPASTNSAPRFFRARSP